MTMRNKPNHSKNIRKLNIQDGDIVMYSGSMELFKEFQEVAKHLQVRALLLRVDSLDQIRKATAEEKQMMREILGCCGKCEK